LYCATDNLVAVPLRVATEKSRDAAAISQEVAAEAEKHATSRRRDRRMMWALVAAGPLLVPLLCGAGWLLHQIASS
jgi:hypothetical protein